MSKANNCDTRKKNHECGSNASLQLLSMYLPLGNDLFLWLSALTQQSLTVLVSANIQ